MDLQRTLLAVVLSFLVLFGYQYFFPPPQPVRQPQEVQEGAAPESGAAAREEGRDGGVAQGQAAQPGFTPAADQSAPAEPPPAPAREPRDITVDTPLFTMVISEYGGAVKSLVLKHYRQSADQDSPGMQLVTTERADELPLLFAPDGQRRSELVLYEADRTRLDLAEGQARTSLVLRARLDSGLELERTITFDPGTYLMQVTQRLVNHSSQAHAALPTISLSSRPFSKATAASRYLFAGPAVLIGDELEQVKAKDMAKGPVTFQGPVVWTAYEDSYFIHALIPEQPAERQVTMSASGDVVRVSLADAARSLAPGQEETLSYLVYMGPKKLSILKQVGHDLGRAVNLGWFEPIAKPLLALLNFFHGIVGNYGVAIILVTVLIKLLFWPLTHRGMKSMKNMQKIQPKVARIREKFKDDPTRMNKEMMQLYKTYKVNPLGGCLPMLLQIPVFFALYRILLQAIELRHAPFMLWITDLSAPDRLHIGVDIPFLGGIPVLTLLMGASMYLQQKMTPSTITDPTQARIMSMLPIIFTFMFLNFASGLVLYWFVNNLLSILQQQMVNRQTR